MEPQYISEYKSDFGFRFYDFQGDALLLRCSGGTFLDQYLGGNIDLIFLGVEFIELPTLFRGIRISLPRDTLALDLEYKYAPVRASSPGDRVYAIESEDKRFHVIASNFWIHICTGHGKESSLPILLNTDSEERDRYFIDQVKEWYKIECH